MVKVYVDDREVSLDRYGVTEDARLVELLDRVNEVHFEEDRGVNRVGFKFVNEETEKKWQGKEIWDIPLKDLSEITLYTATTAQIIEELLAEVDEKKIEELAVDFVEKFEKGEKWGESFGDFVNLLERVMRPVGMFVNWKKIKSGGFDSEEFVKKEIEFKEFTENIMKAFESGDYNLVKEIVANEWQIVAELVKVLRKEIEKVEKGEDEKGH